MTLDEAGPSGSKGGKKVISFSGDAEDEDEAVDLLGSAQNVDDGDDDQEDGDGEGGDDEDEPEDDFNAAWEVLDLARALYAKADGEEAQLKLADTYMCLGDVSLETGPSRSYARLDRLLTMPVTYRKVRSSHRRLLFRTDSQGEASTAPFPASCRGSLPSESRHGLDPREARGSRRSCREGGQECG